MIENIRRDLGVGQRIATEVDAAQHDHQEFWQQRERDEPNDCQVTEAAVSCGSAEPLIAPLLVLADSYPMFPTITRTRPDDSNTSRIWERRTAQCP